MTVRLVSFPHLCQINLRSQTHVFVGYFTQPKAVVLPHPIIAITHLGKCTLSLRHHNIRPYVQRVTVSQDASWKQHDRSIYEPFHINIWVKSLNSAALSWLAKRKEERQKWVPASASLRTLSARSVLPRCLSILQRMCSSTHDSPRPD